MRSLPAHKACQFGRTHKREVFKTILHKEWSVHTKESLSICIPVCSELFWLSRSATNTFRIFMLATTPTSTNKPMHNYCSCLARSATNTISYQSNYQCTSRLAIMLNRGSLGGFCTGRCFKASPRHLHSLFPLPPALDGSFPHALHSRCVRTLPTRLCVPRSS